MIQLLQKLFKKKHTPSSPKSTRVYKDGFYIDIDTNTIGEQSKTIWNEYIRDPNGNIIPVISGENTITGDVANLPKLDYFPPKSPPDRIEIH